MKTSVPNKLKTRFYNSLEISGSVLHKYSSEDRIRTEHDWFLAVKDRIPDNAPRIHGISASGDKYQMRMDYIASDNLFHQYQEKKAVIGAESIFQQIDKICSRLHADPVPPNSDDLRQMYLEKPLAALEYYYEHRPDLAGGGQDINGLECGDPRVLLAGLYKKLEDRIHDTNFSVIHGDLTLSNMIADAGQRIYLLDPRGKFGNSKLVGDIRYDIAKLYFSAIADFDSLNYHKFYVDLPSEDTKDFHYSIDDTMPGTQKRLHFWEAFGEHDKEVIEFINCTIWLSLFPHLQEGEDQSLAAYLHGLYMLEDLNRRLG